MGPILQEQVCYTLYSTSGVITQAYRALLAPLKLTYPQYVVMIALLEKDKVSVTALAATVGLTKPTMTPLLKRLELLEYITRDYEPGDDRTKSIALTTLGRSLASDIDDVAKKALCATGLSDDEAAQLLALCGKIKRELT